MSLFEGFLPEVRQPEDPIERSLLGLGIGFILVAKVIAIVLLFSFCVYVAIFVIDLIFGILNSIGIHLPFPKHLISL